MQNKTTTRSNSSVQVCQNCKNNFVIDQEDFSFYEKIKVPPPTFCWECRHQRRLSFRNERVFYKRNCDLCGKSVVSRVSPDKSYKMYCTKCWWSDKWDPKDFGVEIDFSRSFLEQWKELFFKVPHISIFNSNVVNSDWVNQETDDKNCYLNVGGLYNEDSAYNTYEVYGKNCFDNYWILNSDHCSNDIHTERCYFTHFSQEVQDCLNTAFSYDCRNCNNVIGCIGLRNKKYCIFNKQYTKEGYEEFLQLHPLSSDSSCKWWKVESKKIWDSFPHRENTIFKSVNSTGDCLIESKNSKNCWESTKIENSKNLFICGWMRDCFDCTCMGASELGYEIAHSGGAYNSKVLLFCLSNDPLKKMTINDVEYSAVTTSSSNCFGCVGLRNAEYMILNKKYSKEEYEKLLPKIKQHMIEVPFVDKKGNVYRYGEFFPSEFSPFGYNETTAGEFIELSKEEALAQGYIWSDYVSNVNYEFSNYEIPDDIKDVKNDILEKVLKCEDTGKAYKITEIELSFYRQAGLPIPRISPQKRHSDRVKILFPCKLFIRKCHKCGNKIETAYSPDRPEIIYCEKCYQQEVY
ncbi:MAG: hypothetical protein WCI93_01170 [bacterium]